MTVSRSSSFANVTVANVEGNRQSMDNDKLITLNTVHREVIESLKNIDKSLLNEHFIVSTCRLFTRLKTPAFLFISLGFRVFS